LCILCVSWAFLFKGDTMPANLTPDYLRADEEYRKAVSSADRLEALKKMLSALPKHKGTEKMQADLKHRIAAMREEIQQAGRKKGHSIKVEKEGGGQVVFAGPPNSGKSQLISRLTGTSLEIAPYPFTTHLPHPAMMSYQDIHIQLVDLPPVCSQHIEPWLPAIIRGSDLILLIADLSSPSVLDDVEDTLQVLAQVKIDVVAYKPPDDFWASVVKKRLWLVGNKLDMPGATDNWQALRDLYYGRLGLSTVSAETGAELEGLKKDIFNALEILRVYSKPPGKAADVHRPFIVKKGSTLLDFANQVHRDFGEKLKFARVWGHSKFEGQRVNHDYLMQDRDIVELHL
jgi:uncharacterized protein